MVNKVRAVSFDLANKIREGDARRDSYGQMDMVVHSADCVYATAQGSGFGSNDIMERGFENFRNK